MNKFRWLPTITAIFVTSLIISNLIAVKIISFGPFSLPAAIIIFPISYIFGDVLTEVYGYARARQVIWIGFGCNLLAVLIIWVSIQLPPAPFWNIGPWQDPGLAQQAYAAIFGFTPRLLFASFIAYLLGEFLNSFVLAKMKVVTAGRHLWLRMISSTLVGQLADSGVFISLAFYGLIPMGALGRLILTQWLFKSFYEAAVTPLTYLFVNYLKRIEGLDYFDRDTKFTPWKWKD
jgi:uncharacterized integral membrane protein (TIGR00697 family)